MTTPPPPPPPSSPPPPPPFGGPPGPSVPPPPSPIGSGLGAPRPSTGMATAALVCGIVGLPLFVLLVLPIVAVVLGFVAASKAKGARRAGGQAAGLGRARAGWILGLVGIALFVLVIVVGAIAGWYDEEEVNDLDVGDCVELDVDADELATLPVVDCDEPHEGEVFYVADLFGDRDDFPGTEAISRQVEDACAGAPFEDFVGTPYLESSLGLYYAAPSEQSWDRGDRTAVCFVIRPDGESLERSVRGSGL